MVLFSLSFVMFPHMKWTKTFYLHAKMILVEEVKKMVAVQITT